MTNRETDFALYCAARDALHAALDLASARLNRIEGIGSGPMGLTPEPIRRSTEYKSARAAYSQAHLALGQLNQRWCKHFAPELRAERDAKRAAKLAALAGERAA